MSLLIKGFNIPKKGDTFEFVVTFGYDKMAIIDTTGENDPIFFDVTEVPTPHGRLIDAKKLKEDNPRYMNQDVPYVTEVTVEEIIDFAPTVIEAERSKK